MPVEYIHFITNNCFWLTFKYFQAISELSLTRILVPRSLILRTPHEHGVLCKFKLDIY